MTEAELAQMQAAFVAATQDRDQLSAITGALNARLTALEQAIKGLRLGVSGRVAMEIDDHWLTFGKEGGMWRLLVIRGVDSEHEEVVPLINAPRYLRIAAVKLLPALIIQMVENVGRETERVRQGITEIDNLCRALSQFAVPKAEGET